MRSPFRGAGCLAVVCLSIGALAGCQDADVLPTTTPSTAATTPTPAAPAPTRVVTTPTRSATSRATSAAQAPAGTARGRRSTSGEEQLKYGCEHGEIAKADCDSFFKAAARDGVRFNQ